MILPAYPGCRGSVIISTGPAIVRVGSRTTALDRAADDAVGAEGVPCGPNGSAVESGALRTPKIWLFDRFVCCEAHPGSGCGCCWTGGGRG
jgi:hypothetical protein